MLYPTIDRAWHRYCNVATKERGGVSLPLSCRAKRNNWTLTRQLCKSCQYLLHLVLLSSATTQSLVEPSNSASFVAAPPSPPHRRYPSRGIWWGRRWLWSRLRKQKATEQQIASEEGRQSSRSWDEWQSRSEGEGNGMDVARESGATEAILSRVCSCVLW